MPARTFSILGVLFILTVLPLWANIFIFWGEYTLWIPVVYAFFIHLLFISNLVFVKSLFSDVISFLHGFVAIYVGLWVFFGTWTFIVFPENIHLIYGLLLVVSFLLAIWGNVQFLRELQIKHVQLVSDKISRPYKFLHITDTQFGTLHQKDLARIVRSVEKAMSCHQIDAVLFTGDIVDTSRYSYDDLSILEFGNIPVYFSFGNHEFYHNADFLQSVIDKMGYISLRNQVHAFTDEITFVGIDDSHEKGYLDAAFKKLSFPPDTFNILLFHRPSEVEVARKNNINLMVVGHTHGGQIFPYTLLLKLFVPYPMGITIQDDFALYHSNGAGLWGPKMCLGTINEIAVIQVDPQK